MAEELAANLRDSAATPSAFSLVYEARAEDVLVFLARRTLDAEVARDLTAETFAQAFEHRGRFRGRTDSEAEAWLYGIARHQLGRYARRGVVHRKAVARLGVSLPAVGEEDHQRIVELAGLAELRAVIADALATLPQAQREALQLRVIEEHAYSHIAATLGVSEQTARARLPGAAQHHRSTGHVDSHGGQPVTQRIQALEHLGGELARAAAEAERRSPKRIPRLLAVALVTTVIVAAGTFAVPGTRAAFDSVFDSFAGWVDGDSAPGRAVQPGDNAPTWLRDDAHTRLIAKTEGLGLYVRRTDSEEGPYLEFWLGQAQGMGASLDEWRKWLDEDALVLLGYTPFGRRDPLDDRGRLPVFGVTTRDVTRVEVRYAEGPPLVGETGDGGFVLLADAWRPPRELVGYDASGHVLDRVDVSEFDMRYVCEKDDGCPPIGSSSRR